MGGSEALRAYVVLQQRRGLLEGTIRQRAYMLAAFALWLGPTPLLEATSEQVEAWLDSRRLAPKSRYSSLSTLHCFYAFALAEGFVAEDPTRRILRPRLPRYVPRPMPDDDLTMALFHALHSLGIEATAHTLRHWFATSVYARTLNLRLTQELLGHSDPSTTAVYVAFSPLASAEAVRDLDVT